MLIFRGRSRRRSFSWIKPLLLCIFLFGAAARGGAELHLDFAERLLAVHLNGEESGEPALLLVRRDGALFASRADFVRWRLAVPAIEPLSHENEAYFPLDSVEAVQYRFDEPGQMLFIQAKASAFPRTVISGAARNSAAPQTTPFGGFLNYDISAQWLSSRTQAAALLEQGIFNGFGVGVNSLLVQKAGSLNPLVRLDTTWTLDRPDALASLRLGDAITRSSSWGRSARFGGVQWATNFATRPDLITFPLPSFRGEAVLPSTLDVYVNNSLRAQREVPSGPFTITDLPVITGAGEVQLVVRDLLGRERVVAQPYYATPRLLQKGLHDYSYEMGFIRENYGLESLDYGRFAGVATHRLGLTDFLTAEVRGEVLAKHQNAGVGASMLWPSLGVWHAALAGSRSERGAGALGLFGFERQDRWLSFGGSLQLASERFAQIGMTRSAPRLVGQGFAAASLPDLGSLGLRYVHQTHRAGEEDVALLSVNYSVAVRRLGFLNLFVSQPLKHGASRTLGLGFTVPLGERASASAGVTLREHENRFTVQAQRSLPPGNGLGYRFLSESGGEQRTEAGVNLRTDHGTYSLEAGHSGDDAGARVGMIGGIAFLGGKIFLTRELPESFALVQVPGYADVRVYADNHPVARTDADGNAFLPRLRAYEKNPLRIEQGDLPLDAEIDTLDLTAVPSYRGGLLVSFPVRRARGGIVTVLLDGDKPLPAGAMVRLVDQNQEFPAGARGEIYLAGLQASNSLEIRWREQTCRLAVPYRESPEALPHLGVYRCAGMQP